MTFSSCCFFVFVKSNDVYIYNRTVTVGKVKIGSQFPVAKQTMTTTNTRDVDASVEQVLILSILK